MLDYLVVSLHSLHLQYQQYIQPEPQGCCLYTAGLHQLHQLGQPGVREPSGV